MQTHSQTPSQAHYQNHLAKIYAWMFGGMDVGIERGRAVLQQIFAHHPPHHPPQQSSSAIKILDLGAGCGFHSIPLLQQGYTVLAVDTEASLLQEAVQYAEKLGYALPTQTAEMVTFLQEQETQSSDVILCLTDTILHLSDMDAVRIYLAQARRVLRDGGMMVVTFRDLSGPLRVGTERFLPVRSDDQYILTCFLEASTERADQVWVYDIIYTAPHWEMSVSAYPKLRIAPQVLADLCRQAGFTQVTVHPHLLAGGMQTLVASVAPVTSVTSVVSDSLLSR